MDGCSYTVATNSELLGLKLTPELLRRLNYKYPDKRMRNMAIRAVLEQLVDNKIVVTKHEIKIKSNTNTQ